MRTWEQIERHDILDAMGSEFHKLCALYWLSSAARCQRWGMKNGIQMGLQFARDCYRQYVQALKEEIQNE